MAREVVTGLIIDNEAIVQVRVIGSKGQCQTIDALIDTGYAGYLTLTSEVASALDLPLLDTTELILADGRKCLCDV